MSSVRGVDFSRPIDGAEIAARVRVARVDALFANGPLLVAGALVSGLLAVVILWQRIDSAALLHWLGLLYVWTLARAALVVLYRRLAPPSERVLLWGWLNAAFSTVYGVIWGCGAVVFVSGGDSFALVAVPVLVMGLNAVATVSLTPFPAAYIGFSVLSNGLLAFGVLRGGGDMASPLLALVSISLMSNLINMKNLSKVLDDSLRLRFENQALGAESKRKSGLLETTLANMAQGIGLLDRHGRLRMWNLRLTTLLGLRDPDRGALTLDGLRVGLTPVSAEQEPDVSLWHQPGGRYLEFRETRIGEGETVVTCTDVSLLKRREGALQAARSKAEQASAAKTRFLAAASHDLRQPVHALGLLHQVLSDRSRGTALAPLVGELGQGVKAVDELLQELLDISKLEAGLDRPVRTALAVGDLFRELAEEFRLVAEQRHIGLKFRTRDLTISSDRNMLLRVLRNLVVNALNYTSQGRVLVVALRRADQVCLRVYDTGPGIPADQTERIFEEFQQLHNPQRDRRRGLGLGLAIVRHTARLLGHPVSVRSRLGSGSCFEVRVPNATRAVVERGRVDARESAGRFLTGRLLWVVDDDPIVLVAVTTLLEHWGCRVESALDSDGALALAGRGGAAPDGLLLDYRLPGRFTGLDLARVMVEALGYPLPCLLITGDTAPQRLREASAGGIPLLHKPVSAENLRSAVIAMLASEPAIGPASGLGGCPRTGQPTAQT